MNQQSYSFKRIFSREQMREFAQAHNDPKEAAALEAGQRIAAGDICGDSLVPIVKWKAELALHQVRGNSEADIQDALRCVHVCAGDRARVAVLLGLRGVDISMASAILTAYAPEAFTVIDWRVLESLGRPRSPYFPVDLYLAYLGYCKMDAERIGLSLRNYDRALWWGTKIRKNAATTA